MEIGRLARQLPWPGPDGLAPVPQQWPGAATNVARAGGNLPPAALGTGVKGAQG